MDINSNKRWPWIMLVSRVVLLFGIQAIFALCFLVLGKTKAWENAASLWPFVVTITNLICLYILVRLFKMSGMSFWNIFRLDKSKIGSDLLSMLVIIIIIGPVSYLPNIMLGTLLFGDPLVPLNLILHPLPYYAVLVSIIAFPVTQGLVEIPVYFSYVMPQLKKQGLPTWVSVGLPSLFLSLQHISVPFLFNIRFITWRAFMFLPFALLTGIVMKWRPRLMPYVAIVHIFMDAAFAAMLLDKAF